MRRFEMARALVDRAEERIAWIGDDHGDPYEAALISRSVSVEMHVAIKEVLDHLRSALDYCAHEVCETTTAALSIGPIYFPITSKKFSSKDFVSRVCRLMPGLSEARPDLVSVLARFQPFSSPDNDWLADLATLSNRTKHVELSVNCIDVADVVFDPDQDSGGRYHFVRRADGSDVRVDGLALIEAPNGLHGVDCKLVYLRLDPINQGLLSFLKPAPISIRGIINAMEVAL